jgi:hypothetical protein
MTIFDSLKSLTNAALFYLTAAGDDPGLPGAG